MGKGSKKCIMKIFGDKTVAFFDIWSIEHFVSGITLGSVIILIFGALKLQDKNDHKFNHDNNNLYQSDNKFDHKLLYFVLVAFLAYLWETVEHYLESGLLNNHVTYWFQGVEFWGNRILTDPWLVVLGSFIYLKYNYLGKYARYFSATWLYFHVFVFPHCMYLQDELIKIMF